MSFTVVLIFLALFFLAAVLVRFGRVSRAYALVTGTILALALGTPPSGDPATLPRVMFALIVACVTAWIVSDAPRYANRKYATGNRRRK